MPAMPKTADELVRETLGSYVIEVAMLRQDVDILRARVAELTPKPAEVPPEEGG